MSTIILASGVGERRRARKLYDATLDRSWEYDQVGRLMHAYSGEEARAHVGRGAWGSPTGPYAHSYEYDVWGNMVRRVGWGGWNAAYEASYAGNRRVGFEYDGAGDVVNDGRQQYGYDAVWRQVRAQGSGYRLEQRYDGDGLRVKKDDNGEVVYYIRSSVLGGQVVAEIRNWGGGWIWSRGYVYWPDGELMAVQQGGVRWVHRDPVVKSQRLTDEAGNVVAVIELDPWGGETDRSVNPWQQPYRYTTYERDGNGVDQALMRSYQGWWTRFNEPDPWDGSYDLTDPQSFNRYAYVRNDPVNYVDPSGLDRFCIIDVSYRHVEYINRDGDQTIRIETILHQTCFDVPTAPIGGGEVGGGGGGAPVSVPTQSPTPAPITSNQPQHPSKSDAERLAKALAECTTEHFGLNSLLGLMGLRLGQPTRPKVGAMGSIPGTSRASELSRGIFGNAKLPFKLPAPTFSSLRTLTITSARVGTVVGRAVPVVGAAMVTYDAVSIGNCVKRYLRE